MQSDIMLLHQLFSPDCLMEKKVVEYWHTDLLEQFSRVSTPRSAAVKILVMFEPFKVS